MATEKATPTTATQNPAPGPTPSRARATRSKTTGPSEAPAAPKRTRAKSAGKSTPSAVAQAAQTTEAAALESVLLEKEASKSLAHSGPCAPKAAKAHCGQCGREMRFVPFTLSNLMCRSCYGLDRYRRPASPTLSSLTAPRPGGPR